MPFSESYILIRKKIKTKQTNNSNKNNGELDGELLPVYLDEENTS